MLQHIAVCLSQRWLCWVCNFGIRLIELVNEYIQSSQCRLIWKRPCSSAPVLQSAVGPVERTSSITQARAAGGGLTSPAPPVCLISGEENLIPPTLPLSPCLDECAHCTMSRRVCDFTVWVGSPHPKLSTSLRAACWTVGELVCRKRSPLQREAFWVPTLQTEHHKGLNEKLLLGCLFYL